MNGSKRRHVLTDSGHGVTGTVRALRAGDLGPVELVEECLKRIQASESEVGAWVEIDAENAKRTAARQAALSREEARGLPLLGIPIGIKDIIDVAGLPTRAGSALRAGHRAECDAPIVKILRDLGAIILGKTETTQFACQDPARTRNPWNLERSPGGSSAGSAAAVASGMCLAALGTQTGGSITRPASFCGVASFKGAWGAWPLEGIVPVSAHLDHVGPMARSVADLALLWTLVEMRLHPERAADLARRSEAIVAGEWRPQVRSLGDSAMRNRGCPDQRRGRTGNSFVPDEWRPQARSLGDSAARNRGRPDQRRGRTGNSFVQRHGWAPPRLAVIEEYFFEESEASALDAFKACIARLEEAGAAIERLALPASFAGMPASHRMVMAVEAAQVHREDFAARPETYRPGITRLIEEGLSASAVDYRAARVQQQRFAADLAAALDAPAVPVGQAAPAGLAGPVIALSPATVSSAPPLAEQSTGDPRFNSVWSFSGLSTCGVPACLDADGLPLGLQLGTARESLALFQAAAWCEAVLAFPGGG